MSMLDIPLFEMEELERKYGISMFVEQYVDPDTPDSYWQVIHPCNDYLYLGHTIDEVKKELMCRYGY